MTKSSESLVKNLGIAFIIAIVFYIVAFTWIEHRRSARGPWHVVFLTDFSGQPSILISQKQLGIANVKLVFSEKTLPFKNTVRALYFDAPGYKPAFGEVVFIDLLSQPGTVVFNFWGHEVQLMPRVLTIDKKEQKWESGKVIVVQGPGKFIPNPKYKQ
jgi:hypothetical protein